MRGSNGNNLLLATYGYAKRQGENFTTAAFVHLLRHLRDNEITVFADVVRKLTHGWMNLGLADARDALIQPQSLEKEQRPDLQIIAQNRKAIIEIKLWAQLKQNQLGYAGDDSSRLVIITMDALSFDPPQNVIPVRWSEVEQWLDGTFDEVSAFLVNQFKSFVAARRVSGPDDGGLTFLTSVLRERRFQFALIPLVRKELSINGLVNLFLEGIQDRAAEPELHEMFGQDGCVAPHTSPGVVRDWIYSTLRARGLSPDRALHSVFKYVAYPRNGQPVDLTAENLVGEIGYDMPIRIVCLPIWFDKYGRNPDCNNFLGGIPATPEVFYGKDGNGGRFPLRPGTAFPRDLRVPTNRPAMPTEADIIALYSQKPGAA